MHDLIYQVSNVAYILTYLLVLQTPLKSLDDETFSKFLFSHMCPFSPLPTVEILCRNTKPCRIATQFINTDLLESFNVYSLFLINVRPATLPRYLYINLLLLSQL